MKYELRKAETAKPRRIYIAAMILRNFRGQKNVEVQIFRADPDPGELEELRGLNLVGSAPVDMPEELLQGATEDAALGCLLEAFTLEEAELLADYLQSRYDDQAEKLIICPLDLPLPLGIGPLAKLPAGDKSGFLNFDRAPGYTLPFRIRGYFELG